jgi:glycosyltransferase involved in cell wall biosynthesis
MSKSTVVSQMYRPAHHSQTPIPIVSIGMPVYNGEKYLEQMLASLLNQSLKNFELTISDNASTDKTEKIYRAYTSSSSPNSLSRYENNQGSAWNFDNVVNHARCKFFM